MCVYVCVRSSRDATCTAEGGPKGSLQLRVIEYRIEKFWKDLGKQNVISVQVALWWLQKSVQILLHFKSTLSKQERRNTFYSMSLSL